MSPFRGSKEGQVRHFMRVLTLPRRPRTQFDAVPLHAVQRGHDRERCFCAEENYCACLRISLPGLRSGGQRNFLFASCHLNNQAAMIFGQLFTGV